MKFSITYFFSKCDQIRSFLDFLCSDPTWNFFFLRAGATEVIWREVRQRFIMVTKNNLNWGFLLVAKSKIPFDNLLIHLSNKIQNKSPTFFSLRIGWKKKLERPILTKTHQSLFQNLLCWHKHVQSTIVPAVWDDPALIILLRFVFDFDKTLNDRSVEQEAVGMMLRMTMTFPKFHRAFSPRNIGWHNNTVEYVYTEITQTIFFHIFYHRCREYWANFGRILFANIGQ